MGRYWTDKEDFKDTINAVDYNNAFSAIENDITTAEDDIVTLTNATDELKDTKVDKEDGKGLIDEKAAEYLSGDDNGVNVADGKRIFITDSDGRLSAAVDNQKINLYSALGRNASLTTNELRLEQYDDGKATSLSPVDGLKFSNSYADDTDIYTRGYLHLHNTNTLFGGVKVSAESGIQVADGEIVQRMYSMTDGTITESHKLSEKANQTELESTNLAMQTLKKEFRETMSDESTETSVLDNSGWDEASYPPMYEFTWYQDDSKNDIAGIYVYGYNGSVTVGGISFSFYISAKESRDEAVNIVTLDSFKSNINSYFSQLPEVASIEVGIYPNSAAKITIDKVTLDYQPVTKKYVDDTIKTAIENYNTEAMALLGED